MGQWKHAWSRLTHRRRGTARQGRAPTRRIRDITWTTAQAPITEASGTILCPKISIKEVTTIEDSITPRLPYPSERLRIYQEQETSILSWSCKPNSSPSTASTSLSTCKNAPRRSSTSTSQTMLKELMCPFVSSCLIQRYPCYFKPNNSTNSSDFFFFYTAAS